MLGMDVNGSHSAHESSSDKESNDPSDNVLANEPSTSKAMAQHVVFHVHKLRKEVFEKVT